MSEFEFDIMKMAGEHDVDWTKLQDDKVWTHTQRHPDYPFFDAPGDRAKPSASGQSERARGHYGLGGQLLAKRCRPLALA